LAVIWRNPQLPRRNSNRQRMKRLIMAAMRYGEKRPAADKGVVAAQMALARDHLEGKNGARKSVRSAARWLTKAAEQGEAEAQFMLAELLMNGSRELKAKP
jgi:TPR repeat protein